MLTTKNRRGGMNKAHSRIVPDGLARPDSGGTGYQPVAAGNLPAAPVQIKGTWGFLHFLALLAFALALAGCGAPGAHALLKGKKLLDRGDYAVAVDEFKSATDAMSTNAVAWDYLGVAEQHAGQLDDAAKAYQRALELDRDLTEAHYNLGCLWLEENKPDQAASEFTAYTLRRENTPEGWVELGYAQLRLNDILSAEKSFSTALYWSQNNAQALNGLGLARMQRGRPQEAEKFFQAAVQSRPDYGPAILNLATVEHEYLHDDRAALDEYHAYLALNPKPANWDEVNAIANSLEPSSPVAAAAPPQQPRQNSPEWQRPSVAESNGTETSKQETRKQASRLTRHETRRDETDYNDNNNAPPQEPVETVQVQPEPRLASSSNPAPASPPQRDLFGSVDMNPQSGNQQPIHWIGGESTQEEVKVTPLPPANGYANQTPVHIVQPAPPAFPRYLYLSPAKPAAGDRSAASEMFAKARQNEESGNIHDALDDYHRAAQLDPSWFEAQYNCGVLAYRLGDIESSLSAYETALVIKPDSADARYNFALALQAASYVPDAVEQLKKILASSPNDVRAHLELGYLYAQKLFDVANARREYLKVLELDPGNPQASNIQFWLSANPP